MITLGIVLGFIIFTALAKCIMHLNIDFFKDEFKKGGKDGKDNS